MHDLGLIFWKELCQISGRRRFHFEKGLFAAGSAVAFALVARQETGLDMSSLAAASEFSRSVFFPLSVVAYAVLSFLTFVISSGIVVSETAHVGIERRVLLFWIQFHTPSFVGIKSSISWWIFPLVTRSSALSRS